MTIAVPSLRAVVCAPGWVRNDLWRRARAVPSLDLRFAENKSLVDAISGQNLITFTRASSGTYVGSDGLLKTAVTNEPRFDHNPLTGECLGLLVEEQRTNLLTYSQEFNNVAWTTGSGGYEANATNSPMATLTADKLVINNGVANSNTYQSATITSGATVTGSVFVKADGSDRVEIVLLGAGNITPYGRATFSAATGAVTTAATTANGGTNASTATTSYANGWYRVSVTVTYPATTAAGMRILIFNSDSSNGDDVKGVFLWGAQLEAGAFPTSYIPTTTSAATRAADLASITGSAFSSWYRQDEGTMFCTFSRAALIDAANFANLWSISDNTASERYLVYNTGSSQTIDSVISDGGVDQVGFVQGGAITVSVLQNHCLAYRQNDFAAVRNAGLVDVDTLGSLPTVNRLWIGANHAGNAQFSAPIRRLTYWPQRLPNATLQAITQ